jgi:ribonuclease PH
MIRPLFLTLSSNAPSASGSCYVEIGTTKVLCSVYGPREATNSSSGVFGSGSSSSSLEQEVIDASSSLYAPRNNISLPNSSDITDDTNISQSPPSSSSSSEEDAHGILECTVQFAPFAKRERSGIGGTIGGVGVSQLAAANTTLIGGGGGGFKGDGNNDKVNIIEEERKMSRFLERALSPTVLLSRIPKCIVEVHVWVLEAGGAEAEAAVIGTSMALVDAGVEVIDLCVSATVVGVRNKIKKREQGEQEGNNNEKIRFLVGPIMKKSLSSKQVDGKEEENENEESDEEEVLRTSICMMMKRELLTHTSHEGAAEGDEIIEALNVAMTACASSYQVMRETLTSRASALLESKTK